MKYHRAFPHSPRQQYRQLLLVEENEFCMEQAAVDNLPVEKHVKDLARKGGKRYPK